MVYSPCCHTQSDTERGCTYAWYIHLNNGCCYGRRDLSFCLQVARQHRWWQLAQKARRIAPSGFFFGVHMTYSSRYVCGNYNICKTVLQDTWHKIILKAHPTLLLHAGLYNHSRKHDCLSVWIRIGLLFYKFPWIWNEIQEWITSINKCNCKQNTRTTIRV